MNTADNHGTRTNGTVGDSDDRHEQTTVRLPAALLSRVRVDAALQRGVTMSSIFEAALIQYYKSRKAHRPLPEYPE